MEGHNLQLSHDDRLYSGLRRGPGTYFSGAAESAARLLLRAESCVTDIACAWLPDHDLSGLGKDYGLDLASEPSVCERDASGRFFPSTIRMADLGIKIRPPLPKDQRHRDGLTGPALGQV
jgi:hypothetical protein